MGDWHAGVRDILGWVGGMLAAISAIAEAHKFESPMAVLEFICCWGRKSACFKPTVHHINTRLLFQKKSLSCARPTI